MIVSSKTGTHARSTLFTLQKGREKEWWDRWLEWFYTNRGSGGCGSSSSSSSGGSGGG